MQIIHLLIIASIGLGLILTLLALTEEPWLKLKTTMRLLDISLILILIAFLLSITLN